MGVLFELIGRQFLAVIRMLPLILVVVLSAPAWISWVFLPVPKQQAVLDFMQKLIDWAKAAK